MNFLRRIFGSEPPPAETVDTTVPAEDTIGQAVATDLIAATSVEAAEQAAGEAPPGKSGQGTVADGATRQLPSLDTALSRRPTQHMVFGQSSDVGMVRSNNQDSVLTIFASQGNTDQIVDFGLFIVADGMGGHHDGEKASAIASRVLAQHVSDKVFLPMLNSNDVIDIDHLTTTEILTEAVKHANEVVVKKIPEGGTTVTAAAVLGDLAHIVHVGDSRAYLVSASLGMEQITRDHSLVQRLIELDQLTPEEAAQHPQKNVLYRALGQSDSLEVDTATRRLPAESFLLLCSDGLWNMVAEEDVLDIILNSETPQEACDRLVVAANECGGSDNISAIVLQIPG